MTLEQEARNIKAASPETIAELIAIREEAVSEMNKYILESPDRSLFGDNEEAVRHNHNNHYNFVISYISTPDYNILKDTVEWVFRSYQAHGFSLDYFKEAMEMWKIIFKRKLSSQAYKEIEPLYNWFLHYIEKV
ncbi:MAG: hypothetical protein JXR56_09755 [Candidatus Cloacimonetes bacterium]|nr:hypothetical protein [Candidatus Cloacimonadota bacterium]